jgi:biopolymer transport protein ExbB/TolQ
MTMVVDPQSITVTAAAVAAASAASSVFVAYQQWRLAQAKLRLEQFEKRFAVYESTLNFLQEALRNREWPSDGDAEFRRQIETARFLFPDAVADKLTQIRRVIIDMSEAAEAAGDALPDDPERPGFLKQRRDAAYHLRNEIPRLAKIFAPHMKVQR